MDININKSKKSVSKTFLHNANVFLLEFQTISNFKHEMILPVAASSNLSKIYQKTYFNLFKNILGKLIHLLFFLFCYTITLTTDFCYLEWLSSIELWRKKKITLCWNIRHNLHGKIICKYKNDSLVTLKKLVRKIG